MLSQQDDSFKHISRLRKAPQSLLLGCVRRGFLGEPALLTLWETPVKTIKVCRIKGRSLGSSVPLCSGGPWARVAALPPVRIKCHSENRRRQRP